MIVNYSKVRESTRAAHQSVTIDDVDAGEVWREQVHVPDSKGRQILKWRWFARSEGDQTVLGRGTRATMILGAGYADKGKATTALASHRAASSAIEDQRIDQGDQYAERRGADGYGQ